MSRTAKKRSRVPRILNETLFVCFLIAIYTEVPIDVGQVFIPAFFVLLFLAPILALLYRNRIYKYEAAFVTKILSVLLLTALLSPGLEFIGQKMLGLLQTGVSITIGVLFLKLLDRLDRKRASSILLALAVILVAGALLEVLGVLREASDAFRDLASVEETIGSGYSVYDAEVRDTNITGFSRPKLFTSEPSLLAIGFLAFINSWLLLVHTKKNYLLAVVLTLLLFVLTGSPILVISVVTSTIIVLYDRKQLVRLGPTVAGLSACFLASLILVLAFPDVFSNTMSRFDSAFSIDLDSGVALANNSIGLRVILPFITLMDVLQNSPLFGVGISGKEVLEEYSRFKYLSQSQILGNNNVATLFVYLGIVGSVLFVWTFVRFLRRNRLKQVTPLIIMVVALSLSMGGFESPRYWGYVFLFIGVAKMSQRVGTQLAPARHSDRTATRFLGAKKKVNRGV